MGAIGLKQGIVIKSEFTVKYGDGKGTRGGSPGQYVSRYMARKGATEDVTPVSRTNIENIIDTIELRYVKRKNAADKELVESAHAVREELNKQDGYGGVAFGYGSLSLSEEAFNDACKDIQENFDNGKTVFKTVLSFSQEYLKQHGIVAQDFVCEKAGDYRGHIDQMKLREAITHGVEKMSRSYDDLQFVGVIQVDTKHVHCHLAMVDRGVGMLRPDGEQKGMLSQRARSDIRRGIDLYLDENRTIQMMMSNVHQDERNAKCFVKKFAHKTMERHGEAQFLLACLPENRTAWRADSNSVEMRKANQIVREYVEQVLAEPNSGFKEALQSQEAYAMERRNREGLTDAQYRSLLNQCREGIIKDCMGGVYAVLRQIPPSEMPVRTPMLDVMSLDYETAAAKAAREDDDFVQFGFKLRSYSSRLDHHKKEARKYHELREEYESIENASEASHVMWDFYAEEEEYNMMLMCKYREFLKFIPPSDVYEDEFKELMEYKHKMEALRKMIDDKDIKRFKTEDAAEEYGVKVYGQHGGQYVKKSPEILERRFEKMQETYAKREDDFKRSLAEFGMSLDERGISMKSPYDFDDVKALDIHHLRYDFHHDINISHANVEAFIEAANRRTKAYEAVKEYLIATGQEDALEQFPGRDIELMQSEADSLSKMPVLNAIVPVSSKKHGSRTVRLDRDFSQDMNLAVKAIIIEENQDEIAEAAVSRIQYGDA